MVEERPMLAVSFSSHVAHVNCARSFFAAVCKAYGVDEEITSALALAVHEALTNVIRHGHQHQSNKLVQLICYPHPDRMEIHILDEGEPFDIGNVPDLDPAELRVGGRGVFLMRAAFDELCCEQRPEGGNRLRLVKFCKLTIPPPSTG